MRNGLIMAIWMSAFCLIQTASGQNIQIVFAATQPSCTGYTNGTITAQPSGGAAPYSYQWDNGQSGQTNFGLSAGTYTVTVTDQNGLKSIASTVLSQPGPITATIEAIGFNCSPNGTLVAHPAGGTGSGYTYTWTGGATTQSIPVSASGLYYVTITDANGCIGVFNRYIPPAIVTTVVPTDIPCSIYPNGGSVLATVAGGITPYTFLWNTGATTQQVNNIPAGTYTVTITDHNNCTASSTGVVHIPPPLDATVTVVAPACGGNTGSGTVQAFGGTPPYTYNWVLLGIHNQTATNLAPGSYYVCVFDANGCQKDIYVIIPPGTGLSVSLLLTKAECAGVNNGTATAVVNPPGNYIYHWNIQPNIDLPQINGIAPNTLVSVTVTDPATQCMGTASGTVGTHNQVHINVTDVDVPCIGDNTGSALASAYDGTAPYSYLWTFPNGTNVPGAAITGLGVGAYQVTATDSKGCTALAVANISALSTPHAEFSVLNLDCVGDSLKLQLDDHSVNNNGTIVSWSWTVTTTSGLVLHFNQQHPPVIKLPNNQTGTVQLTVTSNTGCTDTAIHPFTINGSQQIVVSLSAVNDPCTHLPVPIKVTGDPNYSYHWLTTTNLTPVAGTPADVVVNPTVTTTYYLAVSNGACAADTFQIKITRNDLIKVSAGPDSIVTCKLNATLSASVNVQNATIKWYTINHDSIGNTPSITVPAGTPPQSYIVVATDANHCTASDTIRLKGVGTFVNVIKQINGSFCDNGPVDITVTGAPNNMYIWLPPNFLTFSPDATHVIANPPTTMTYSLIADNGFCRDTLPVQIKRHVPINLALSQDEVITCKQNPVITATVSVSSNATVQWFNANHTLLQTGLTFTATASPNSNNVYTVVATDSDGCSETKLVTVKGFSTGATAHIDATQNNCDNLPVPVTITGDPNNMYTWSPTTDLTFTPDAAHVTLNPPASTLYQVIASNGFCKDTLTVPITRHIPIGLTVSPDSVASCQPTVTLTASVTTTSLVTIKWFLNGVLVHTGSPFTAPTSPAATYTVVATDASGCTDSKPVVVKTHVPNASVSSDQANLCDNLPVHLTVTGDAGNTYSWTPATWLTYTPDVTHVTVDPPTTTVYDLIVDNGFCKDTFPVSVTRHTPIGLSVGPDSVFSCQPTTILTANVSTTSNVTITWLLNGQVVHTGTTFTVSTTPGNTYTVVATDASGCTDSKKVTVTGTAADVSVDPTLPISACENTPLQLGLLNHHPGDILTYNWQSTGLTITPANAPNPTATGPAGSYVITVTVTNQYNCTATLTIPVTIQPNGVIDGKIDIDLCKGKTATFSNTSGQAGIWQFGDGLTSTQNPVTHTYTAAGSYTVHFIPNLPSCYQPFVKAINVPDADSVQAAANAVYQNCVANAVIQFNDQTVHGAPIVSWNWTFSAGTPATSTSQNPTVTLGNQTQLTGTLIVTDAHGCKDTAVVPVQVNIINDTIAQSAKYCPGSSIALNPQGADPNYVYHWTSSPADPNLNASAPNPVVSPTVTTVYSLTITNGLCSTTFAETVTPLTGPTVDAGPAVLNYCGNGAIKLMATHGNSTSIKWSDHPNFPNPLLSTTDSLIVSPTQGTNYYVQVTSADGCTARDTVRVNPDALGIQALSPNLKICKGGTTGLNVSVINPNPNDQLTYQWSPNLPGVSNPTVSPSINTTYHVTVTNQNGCKDTTSFHVSVSSLAVTAHASPDTVFEGQQFTLTATTNNPSGNGVSYHWSPSDSLESPHQSTTLGTIKETTVFTVVANDDNGCPDTAHVTVYIRSDECVEPYVFVPLAFTPNNDGNNDFFMVRAVKIKKLRFIVWNRWGEILYETTQPESKGWDGTYNGKELTPDAYPWYLELYCENGAVYQKKGNVTLLK